MRVLFLSAWCPWPSNNGVKQRIYHLLRGLSCNHTVDLISFAPDTDIATSAAHLRQMCRDVTLLPATPFARDRLRRLAGWLSPTPRSIVADYNAGMAELVRERDATHTYDVVIASELHMVPYARRLRAPVILEDLELGSLYADVTGARTSARRLRSALTWLKTRRYVGKILQSLAGVTFVSETERTIALSCTERMPLVAIVPNGIDIGSCQGSYGEPEPETLIYPGALTYDANFDAVAHYLRDIHPQVQRRHPATRLRVTGDNPPALIAALPPASGVEFTGYLDDVHPAVARAWAEVVPLRSGAGTRLKVLEALALGTPVVSTRKGIEGLDLMPDVDILVADTPQAFAEQTVRLLRSPELRARLSDTSRRVARRYDWSHSVRALENLLDNTVGRKSGHAA